MYFVRINGYCKDCYETAQRDFAYPSHEIKLTEHEAAEKAFTCEKCGGHVFKSLRTTQGTFEENKSLAMRKDLKDINPFESDASALPRDLEILERARKREGN